MTDEQNHITQMNAREFLENGYLQEVNRLFLHPLGLALAMIIDEELDEEPPLLIVIDGRDDPLGFRFEELADKASYDKAAFIAEQANKYGAAREEALGWVQQPIAYEATEHA